MNLQLILLATFVLLKIHGSTCATCSFAYATWGYGCQLSNQIIENETDLIVIDGEHVEGHGDEDVTWIGSENSRISFFPNRLIEHFANATRANFDKSQMTTFLQPVNCGRLIYLTLEDNLLGGIPDEIFTNCYNIRTLVLSGNNFGSVGENALIGLTRLDSLDLVNCNLSSIHPNAFSSLRVLTAIALSFNNLEFLDSNLFKYASWLNTVRLDNNRLRTIPEDIFLKDINLRLVNLSQNQITSISGATFSSRFWISGLVDLSNNLIEELPIFELTTGLTHLNVDNNRIKNIKPQTFEGLWSLNMLRLGNNLIEDLQPGSFQGTRSLTFLFLNSNNISELQPDSLNGLTVLRELWLTDNRLTHLNASPFTSMNSLWTLHVERNQIESIDRQLFHVLPSLSYLNLTGNDDTFSIYRDVNDNPIVPQIGTCSSGSITHLELLVLVFLLTSRYFI